MSRISLPAPSRALVLASLALMLASAAVVLAACPLPPPPPPAAPPPPTAPPPPNESCASAASLPADAPTSGTTLGAARDHDVSCVYEPAGSVDVAYAFDLAERASVRVTSTSGAALALALFGDEDCTGELGCVDAAFGGDEELFVPVVEAGRHFVVVASNGDGHGGVSAGGFTLTLDLGPPTCVGDARDAALLEEREYVGAGDVDTGARVLCPGDVDAFLLAHLGGALSGTLTTPAGDALALRAFGAVVDVDVDGAGAGAGVPTVVSVGSEVTLGGDLPAGFYIVELSEAPNAPANVDNPVDYSLALAHGCAGDAFDLPGVADDALRPTPALAGDATLTGRTLCGGGAGDDDDAFALAPLAAGVVTLTVPDGADVDVDVARAVDLAPYVLLSDELDGASGARVVSFDVDAATPLQVTLSAGRALPWSASVDFAYDAPANDACDARTALPLEGTVSGGNAGAGHDIASTCNGDDPVSALDDGVVFGADVFYALHVDDDDTNLEIALAPGPAVGVGGVAGAAFLGTVSLYAAPPAASCPADLAELALVDVEGAVVDFGPGHDAPPVRDRDACRVERLRAALPAGDYIVVVDGAAGREPFGVGGARVAPGAGAFDVVTRTYPEGFPPPQACVDAIPATLPAGGAFVDVPVPALSELHEMTGSCAGERQEAVLRFTATESAHVVASTARYTFDTVLYVRADDCAGGVELACNDDADLPVGHVETESRIEFDVDAGRTYFVVVDGFMPAARPVITAVPGAQTVVTLSVE